MTKNNSNGKTVGFSFQIAKPVHVAAKRRARELQMTLQAFIEYAANEVASRKLTQAEAQSLLLTQRAATLRRELDSLEAKGY